MRILISVLTIITISSSAAGASDGLAYFPISGAAPLPTRSSFENSLLDLNHFDLNERYQIFVIDQYNSNFITAQLPKNFIHYDETTGRIYVNITPPRLLTIAWLLNRSNYESVSIENIPLHLDPNILDNFFSTWSSASESFFESEAKDKIFRELPVGYKYLPTILATDHDLIDFRIHALRKIDKCIIDTLPFMHQLILTALSEHSDINLPLLKKHREGLIAFVPDCLD